MLASLFEDQPWRRRGSALFVLMISLLTTISAWRAARGHLHSKNVARFQIQLERTKGEILRRMERSEDALLSTRSLYAASQSVERGEFNTFADSHLSEKHHPGLRSLMFVAAVPHAERNAFLAVTRADECPDFDIQPAGERQRYFVIKYLRTSGKSAVSLGHDMGTEPAWRSALEVSRDSAQPLLIRLTCKGKNDACCDTLYLEAPVYRNDTPHTSVAERRAALLGWVAAELYPDELLQGILGENESQFDLEVFDSLQLTEGNLLYDNDNRVVDATDERSEASFRKTCELQVAGQFWALNLTTTPAFDQATDRLTPRLVLGGGMAMSFLLFVVVWSLSNKRETAQKLAEKMIASLRHSEAELRVARDDLEVRVQHRTEELTRSNRSLREEVERRTKAEVQLALKLVEIGQSNTDLNDFAYIVSHDLKAPLRAIGSLAHWIAEDNADALDEESRENLATLISRAGRMDALIDGILRYSRIGRLEPNLEELPSGEIVRDVIDSLAPPENIEVRIEGRFPSVYYDRAHLHQLFQNLIGNAIQYMGKPQGQIVVSCCDAERFWEFSVRDTGVGIEEKHFSRIFKIFQSLKPRDEREATGVGLSLVRAIAEKHGGRVVVESTVGEGTTFYFTILKQQGVPAETAAVVDLLEAGDPLLLSSTAEVI